MKIAVLGYSGAGKSTLARALGRYFRFRGKTRPDMAEGCCEKMDWEFAWWLLYKGRTRQKQE